jgi:hypothetical protein
LNDDFNELKLFDGLCKAETMVNKVAPTPCPALQGAVRLPV